MKRIITDEQAAEICALYSDGQSLRAIASKTSWSPVVILRCLKEANIKTRAPGRPKEFR